MNRLWAAMILLAITLAAFKGLWLGEIAVFNQMMTALFEAANLSVEIALGLVGVLCFWMGVLKLAESSGVLAQVARIMSPFFARVMPEIPRDHPALGHISMNMAANFFGLDNAATPAGIKAMKSMQSLNASDDTASNAQIVFLVINTSAITLFPVTILMYRAQQGAISPSEVFVPILLATSASTLMGLLTVMWVQKLSFFNRVILAYLGVFGLIIGGLVWALLQLPQEQMALASSALGNGLLLLAIAGFIVGAIRKKVAVYEEFIVGAKQGFETAIGILPYLVAMLVAVALIRASGLLELLLSTIRWLTEVLGGDTRFVEALPTALMKPFSGSGARAMMLETMHTHGVDSFAARLASIFQGSTETTFYVLTVYFGAVNIRKLRHAIACGLLADLAGIVAAIAVAYWFFAT